MATLNRMVMEGMYKEMLYLKDAAGIKRKCSCGGLVEEISPGEDISHMLP